jgi:hypothetical protein
MAIMASHFASTSKTWDVFLTSKVESTMSKRRWVKINNLKKIGDISVIS